MGNSVNRMLRDAAAAGDVEEVRKCLQASGVDVNAQPKEGDYDYNSRKNKTPLECAVKSGNTECVELLLAKGVPHSPCDRWGNAPLDDAVRGGHREVAALLALTSGRPVPGQHKPSAILRFLSKSWSMLHGGRSRTRSLHMLP